MTGIIVGTVMVGTFIYVIYRILKGAPQPKTDNNISIHITVRHKDDR